MFHQFARRLRVAVLLGLALCSACGGGGGATTPTNAVATPTTPPVTPPVVPPASAATFKGDIVLASPTNDSMRVNVYSATESGSVTITYGTVSGKLDRQTANATLARDKPLEIALTGLTGDTKYFYRLQFLPADGSTAQASDEYSFQTARAPGATFSFAIQGDSHPERERNEFDAALYQRTLDTVAAGRPDFYIAMGDDFSVDQLDLATIDESKVRGRYTLQRPYFSTVARRAALFLVNGNHEQAARYLLDGTPNNVAVWAQNARNSLYSQPAPNAFYGGNPEQVAFIGQLRNYYSWTWGDALFAVIDPYWASPVPVDNVFGGGVKRSNLWEVTHGDAQYQWLKTTLENSKAKYKFVFAHHVMGTGRGGIEIANLWEWGGKSATGVDEFMTRRPTWATPIHRLMAANKVTIFFQGHDHIWVRQMLDGVTYQTLPEPADPQYALRNADAYDSGDKFPNTGFTRVTVAPTGVRVEYVRTWLPADEGVGKTSGSVAFSYSLP
ncbi:MAG: metallophosphoesterase [Steroidobacteraceae bacterium]